MHAAPDDDPAASPSPAPSAFDPTPVDDDEPARPAAEAPPDGPVADERTGTTIGNYILQERLGRGGMAAVYRAVHRGFDELVAVKLLAPRFGAQPEMLRRFLREAVVMREISARNHHVVRALDFGETQSGEAYLVMDYLTGQDLQQLLAAVGPLPWQRVAPLALQLCDALSTTHAHGIIHRDIKPSNCLLTEENGEQRLKLIDFGVAKDLGAVGTDQTAEDIVLGTPAYLAPELLTGAAEPDARSDIYALGATLYCLLTGRPPYVGRLHSVIAHKQQTEPLTPPGRERPPGLPRVPPAADALVLRALHLDPDRRFQSVMDMADEIRHSLEPGPTTRQLAGAPLGLRAAWAATIVASAAVVLTIGVAPPVRPPPRTFTGGGAPLALADTTPAPPLTPNEPPSRPVPKDSPPPSAALAPAPTDSPPPAALAPVPTDSPPAPVPTASPPAAALAPVPTDSPPAASAPVPTDSPAVSPTPAPAPVPTDSPTPAPVPTDSPAVSPTPAPAPVPTDSPKPPVPADSPPAADPAPAPVDPRQQKVRRLLDKQRETLRRECRDLTGGAKRPRFTLTLSGGAVEAVSATPATFRECVRSTLKSIAFGVDGQYEYSYSPR